MSDKRTFLGHLVISLAIAGGAFFAYQRGVPQTIFAQDESYMTSGIAALLVATALYLGCLAWNVGPNTSSAFGHLAEKLAVMGGLAGTTIGLSLQAKALVGGATSFGALSTSLYTTAAGVIAAALISVMVFNLEAGRGE